MLLRPLVPSWGLLKSFKKKLSQQFAPLHSKNQKMEILHVFAGFLLKFQGEDPKVTRKGLADRLVLFFPHCNINWLYTHFYVALLLQKHTKQRETRCVRVTITSCDGVNCGCSLPYLMTRWEIRIYQTEQFNTWPSEQPWFWLWVGYHYPNIIINYVSSGKWC